MAEETKSTPLYKQTRKGRKQHKVDINDMFYTARQWQYSRNAEDDVMIERLTNGELSFSNFKEYLGTRKKRAVGRGEQSAVQATLSKARSIYRKGYKNSLIQKWNERKISYDNFKASMESLGQKYDSGSDEAVEIKQDIFDAQEAHRGETMNNWKVRYETGAMKSADYLNNLKSMQRKYAPNTEQYNNILEENNRVHNWVRAETIGQKIESGKISIDRGQQLYHDLAMSMSEGSQDRLDLLGIVSNLGIQEHDKFANKENANRTSQIADSNSRQEILQTQFLSGDISKDEYTQRMSDEAALQSRLGVPLPEYDAKDWAQGKVGPTEYKSERVQRYEGTLVGDKIRDPKELSQYKPEEVVKTKSGIYKRPSQELGNTKNKAGKAYHIPEPEFLKYYKESEIDRKKGGIYTKAGVDKRWGTYISDPGKLKNYKEDQLNRFRGRIYTKPGVTVK